MPVDREALRQTFDSAAGKYQAARPEYPDELFEDVLTLSGLRPPAWLLEIGCGTGKATLPLARRGFRITAIELGPALTRIARRNLRAFPDVEVIRAAFEEWVPAQGQSFDLAYAAAVWPWIDPDLKYQKAASLLRPGGHLAVWTASHGFPEGFDPFFTEIQAVYDEIGEGYEGAWPPLPPARVPAESAGFLASGCFEVVGIRRYVWAIDYDAEGYIDLLDTFSGHIAMEPIKREHLYGEIRRRIAERPSRHVHRHWTTVLTVGRVKS